MYLQFHIVTYSFFEQPVCNVGFDLMLSCLSIWVCCLRISSRTLPVRCSFQQVLGCHPAVFRLGVQGTSPVRLLCLSSSASGNRVTVGPVELWLFFLVKLGAALTLIPSPRSPSTISSSRLPASQTCCICTSSNSASYSTNYASAKTAVLLSSKWSNT